MLARRVHGCSGVGVCADGGASHHPLSLGGLCLGETGSKLGQEGWDPPEGSPCPPSICVQMDAIGNTRCERQ